VKRGKRGRRKVRVFAERGEERRPVPMWAGKNCIKERKNRRQEKPTKGTGHRSEKGRRFAWEEGKRGKKGGSWRGREVSGQMLQKKKLQIEEEEGGRKRADLKGGFKGGDKVPLLSFISRGGGAGVMGGA